MDANLRIDEALPDEIAVLRNLAELYVYDFSEITGMELNHAGRFEHDFWRGCFGGRRTPYLFRVDAHLAGFALVDRGSRITADPAVHDVAEFFVVRGHRRQGIGRRAAAMLFDLRRGIWEVRQMARNAAARAFWLETIAAYTGGTFDELILDDDRWRGWVQRFVSQAHNP